MDDTGRIAQLEKPAPLAANGLEALTLTVGDTLDRTRAIYEAGLRYWQAECVRFVEDATADGEATFARLCESKTPLDVLTAEQEWLRARSRSVLEAGMRLVDAYAAASRSAKADRLQRAAPSRGKRQTAA